MTSLLRRAFASLRVWLGLNDPSENRLHPSHGWLLPAVVPAIDINEVMRRTNSRVRFEGGR